MNHKQLEAVLLAAAYIGAGAMFAVMMAGPIAQIITH